MSSPRSAAASVAASAAAPARVETVVNRDGQSEQVDEAKVRLRIEALKSRSPPLAGADVGLVTERVLARLHSGITTRALDDLTAQICAALETTHADYGTLAARVVVSNLHKSVDPSFAETSRRLAEAGAQGDADARHQAFVRVHGAALDAAIDWDADYDYTFFGLMTLKRGYLLRLGGDIAETPQYMVMRVAVFLYADEAQSAAALDEVLRAYRYMSQKRFTHATPTLFNAGGSQSQLLSCFLLGIEDSVRGIYKAVSDCAVISKYAGGIGVHITGVRGNNSLIRSIGGRSTGIGPMCRTFEATALHVNQAGRRNGSFAMYLAPWHTDVIDFLRLKRHQGDERQRARALHYAAWVSDHFMRAVEANGDWHLFCPDECRELTRTHGTPAFVPAYEAAVAAGKARRVLKAREVWKELLTTQIETGEPYIANADAANAKSNQQNLGQIRSSNLCVAPETPLLTETGWHPIHTLKDRGVAVWNGHEFAPTTVRQTGQDKPLLTVRLSNGAELDCTPYHKFYVQETYRSEKPAVVRARDLAPGMKLAKCGYPVVGGAEPAPYAYTHGLFCADGTYQGGVGEERRCGYAAGPDGACRRHAGYPPAYGAEGDARCRGQAGGRRPMLALYGDKIALREHVEHRTAGAEHVGTQGGVRRVNLMLPLDMPGKGEVPVNASVADKLAWLAGYLDGDGCVCRNGGTQSVQATATDKAFLHRVMLLLQTLGVSATVRPAQPAGGRRLPDGRGGHREYDCRATHRLVVASAGVQQLLSLGFQPHRLVLAARTPQRSATRFVEVEAVEDRGRRADTYCFTEPKRAAGLFNGVLAGNCAEIMQFSDHTEYACCTLASVNLKWHVVEGAGRAALEARGPLRLVRCRSAVCLAEGLLRLHGVAFELVPASYAEERGMSYGVLFDGDEKPIGGHRAIGALLRPAVDYPALAETTRQVVRNLERVVDRNYYPVPETRVSNMRHRPLGIGVQGLSDVYNLLRYPFDSPEADRENERMAATIYYAAMQESVALARERGPYETFQGSPLSRGLFQFDLWGKEPLAGVPGLAFDWAGLRRDVVAHGARHSLLTAYMPTASTSQILGNNECFEPRTTNLYRRDTSAGSFICLNPHCVRLLTALGLWDARMKDDMIANRGSLVGIPRVPKVVQDIFKTAWDVSMKAIIDQSATRAPYVCQSQSLNHYVERPTVPRLSSAYFYAWKKGLKTCVYYCHTRAPAEAQKFTLAPKMRDAACASCEG